MKIEITSEQFNLIQNEIIKLEEDIRDRRDQMNTWEFIGITDQIEFLKQILANEEIDLDKIEFLKQILANEEIDLDKLN